MGKLAALLKKCITSLVNDDETQDSIVQKMSAAAGVSPSAVKKILSGDIKYPPMQRIAGFASVLDVTVVKMEEALNEDGSTLELSLADGKKLGRHNTPDSGESKSSFMQRCQAGGDSHDSCAADFNRANKPFSLLKEKSWLFFDGVQIRETDKPNVFLKDILKIGQYIHPHDGWELDVTPEMLEKLKSNFGRMKDNGVDVEVVVDHRSDAEGVRGYTLEMEIDGEDLMSKSEFTSDKGVELAETVKNVSVLIDPDFVDGKGNHYGEAITHVAIVQQPIVPGQRAFEPIAASLHGVPIPVLTFSKTKTGADPMLEKLLALLDVKDTDGIDEEKALALITEKLKEDSEAAETQSTKIEELETSVKELQTAVNKGDHAPKIDDDTLEFMGEAADEKIDARVEASLLSPAAAKLAKAAYVGKEGERKPLMLSRAGGKQSEFQKFLAIIDENNPVELGEKKKLANVKVVDSDVTKEEGEEKKKELAADIKKRAKRMSKTAGFTPREEEPATA